MIELFSFIAVIVIIGFITLVKHFIGYEKLPEFKITKITDIRSDDNTMFVVKQRKGSKYLSIGTFSEEVSARTFLEKYKANGNSFYSSTDLS